MYTEYIMYITKGLYIIIQVHVMLIIHGCIWDLTKTPKLLGEIYGTFTQ